MDTVLGTHHSIHEASIILGIHTAVIVCVCRIAMVFQLRDSSNSKIVGCPHGQNGPSSLNTSTLLQAGRGQRWPDQRPTAPTDHPAGRLVRGCDWFLGPRTLRGERSLFRSGRHRDICSVFFSLGWACLSRTTTRGGFTEGEMPSGSGRLR